MANSHESTESPWAPRRSGDGSTEFAATGAALLAESRTVAQASAALRTIIGEVPLSWRGPEAEGWVARLAERGAELDEFSSISAEAAAALDAFAERLALITSTGTGAASNVIAARRSGAERACVEAIEAALSRVTYAANRG